MKKPAVFLDRDGTINEQMGYINHASRFVLLPRAAQAVRLLNENEFFAIVVSNQSGVARGYFPIDLVHEVHQCMTDALKAQGAMIDGIFFCPHHRQGTEPEYAVDCHCRKPKTGLIEQAQKAFEIDMARSYVIGDRYTEVELAKRCSLKGIMVKTGYGLGDIDYILPKKPNRPAHIAKDLYEAVCWILDEEKRFEEQKAR